jgi:menaquinone-dependent protoporphyrinogen IX oxidase
MSNPPRGAIICKSKYGATKQYAEWLGKKLDLPIFDPDKEFVRLMSYDFLVIGTPIYYGEMLIRKWLDSHKQELAHKKLFYFVVSAAPPPTALLDKRDVYCLPGRITLARLNWKEKFILRLKSKARDMDQVDIRHLADMLRVLTQYCQLEPTA